MENNDMKRLFLYITAALLCLCSCNKEWTSAVDLGVNNTRINISWSQAQEQFDFIFPVYSTGEWTAEIVAGGDWLTISDNSGKGTGYIKCSCQPNTVDRLRAVKMEVAGSGKVIPVYFVVSSSSITAADLADADLDNYLL